MGLMANQTRTLRLRRGDRKVIKTWVHSRTLPRRQVDRAKILLGAARGESSRRLAATVGIARDTARLWIRRYEHEGIEAVERDRPRSGRPRKLNPELEAEIIENTVNEDPPPGEGTHYTSRPRESRTGAVVVTGAPEGSAPVGVADGVGRLRLRLGAASHPSCWTSGCCAGADLVLGRSRGVPLTTRRGATKA